MYRNYHSTYDAHDLHKHFMDLVRRNGYKEDTPVWVIRNSYRILDFSFFQPDSVLFWRTTALKLHKELLKERDDLNSGRGHKNKPAG